MSGAAALAQLRQDRHVSASSLDGYLRCPEQYAHRYLRHTPPAHRAGALGFGTAIHVALATFYRHLVRVEESPVEELHQLFADTWHRELEHPVPVLLDDNDTEDSLLSKGLEMLSVFHEKIERPHKVLDVEAPFAVQIEDPTTGEVLPKLVGIFDAVIEDADGGQHVLEHKSSKVRWTVDRLAYDHQITSYSLAAPLMGLGEADVKIQVLLKQKKADLEVYTTRRTAQDHRELLQVIRGVTTAIDAGAFYPVRDWHCRGCGFAHRCLL